MLVLATAIYCWLLACHGRRVQMLVRDVHSRQNGDPVQKDSAVASKGLLALRSLPDTSAAWRVGPFLPHRRVFKSRCSRCKPRLKLPLQDLKAGMEITGRITALRATGLFVDIGDCGLYGEKALLPASELPGGGAALKKFHLDDMVTCWIQKTDLENEQVFLTGIQPGMGLPFEKFEVGQKIEGKVGKVTKGGMFIDIGGEKEAFLHKMDFRGGVDALSTVEAGDTRPCWIKAINLDKRRVDVTDYEPGTYVPLEDFEIGQKLTGAVIGLVPDGVLFDINAEKPALLHVSELKGGEDALKNFSIGHRIGYFVKSIDLDKRMVLLTSEKPLKVGQEIHGIIKRVFDFGVSVDIGASKRARLHVSELEGGDDALKNLVVGDTISCWIKSIDLKKEAYLANYQQGTRTALEDFKEGQEVSGVVKKVMDFGAFTDIGAETRAILYANKTTSIDFSKLVVDEKIACWIAAVDLERRRVEVIDHQLESWKAEMTDKEAS